MFDKSKPFTFDRVVRMVLTAAVFVGLFMLVSYLRDVLIPFVAAVVIAYILNPLVTGFEHRLRLRRGRAVALTLGSGLLIGFCFTVLIALISIQQIKQFDQSWASFRDAAVAWVGERDAAMATTTSAPADAETDATIEPKTRLGLIELREGLDEFVSEPSLDLKKRLNALSEKVNGTSAGMALDAAIRFLTPSEDSASVIFALLNRIAAGGITIKNLTIEMFVLFSVIVVVFIYLIFILLDYPKYRREWRGFLPQPYRDQVLGFLTEFDAVLRRYFRGQFVIAMSTGVMFAIGFSIIGLPMAVPFGLFVGALNMIPYLQIIAVVPAVGLVLLNYLSGQGDLMWSLIFLVVIFAVVQLIQDAVLTPKIMGKAVGLSPVAILLGVFIWGKLLGFLGLLLAIPLTCLGIAYYRRIVLHQSKSDTSLVTTPE
ncbi:MAG: AI-2E family transporter [Phycisphaerales bacterium]|nr:AI-2E family transporter [Phycisphaerales bacterium]MCB9856926.1 AI-2E family transporter [Phycisphaerales bacterium]MCB9861947.1 AI-2E family transporter [Phycisphaerales bacterium]